MALVGKKLTTLFIGRRLIKPDEIESTNGHLALLASNDNLPQGAIVASDFQTGGKGQAGTKWVSDAGKNLLMSVLFKPDFLSAKKIFLLSKIVSLAVKDALAEFKIDAKIKWPNDIYFVPNDQAGMNSNDKKICGILIENTIRGMQVQQSVIGIGLNVNQEIFPDELPNPVSMKLITGNTFLIDDCLNSVCNHLEKWYLELKAGHISKINKAYLDSLYHLGEQQLYESLGNTFMAKIMDVEEEGTIIMKKEDGGVAKFSFKEVRAIS